MKKRRRQTGKEKIGDHTELENANGEYQEEIDKKQLEEGKPINLEQKQGNESNQDYIERVERINNDQHSCN